MVAAAGIARAAAGSGAGRAKGGVAGAGSTAGFAGDAATLAAGSGWGGAGLTTFLAVGTGAGTFLPTLPFRMASALAALGATLGAVFAATTFALAALADGRTVALRSGDFDFFATAFVAVFLRVICSSHLLLKIAFLSSYNEPKLGITIPPTGGSRRAPHGVDRASGCGTFSPADPFAPSLYGLAV